MNLYEDRRKQAQERLLQQMDMRQRYVDQQQEKARQEEAAQAAEEAAYAKTQEQAAPGNREIDWAGKGMAFGPYGALVGALAGRTANAYDAYHGKGPTSKKGWAGAARSLYTLEDLKRGVQSKQGNAEAGSLAGAGAQYAARQKTAGSGGTAWSQGEKDRIAMSDQQGRDNLALQRMAGQNQQADSGGFKFSSSGDVDQAAANSEFNDPQTLSGDRKLKRPIV